MKHLRTTILLIGVSLIAGGALLFRSIWEDSEHVPAQPSTRGTTNKEAESLLTAPDDGLNSKGEAQRASVPVEGSLFSFVRDSAGTPLDGAVVTWTPIRPEFLGIWVGWANQRWGEIASTTRTATSDSNGRFEFSEDLPCSADVPSVLWATHKSHEPTLAHVEVVGGEIRFPAVMEMASCAPIQVRVVDAQGRVVPGAEIEQTTPIPSSFLADRFDPQARRVLMRKAIAGPDGSADVAAWSGPLLLRATHENLASEAWIGAPRPTIQLELRSTFEVGGAVTTEFGHTIEGEQRIVCQVQRGSQVGQLAILPVIAGAWGPVTLPVLDVDRYRFRIEGWNAEVQERALDVPDPGSSLRVDFTLRAGVDLYTFVQDEPNVAIPDSTSIVSWDQDGLPVQVKGHPVEGGHTVIRGIPPGVIRLRAEAPGYVPEDGGMFEVPEDPPSVIEITLHRGRRLEGRVLWNGEPVEDFDITSWSFDPSDYVTASFQGRPDGTFTLEAVSTGPVYLNASTPGRSPSETAAVDPGEQSPPPLTLELRELVRGRGQVVDAATGEPLAEATIQPYFSRNGQTVAPWGPEISAGIDGKFDCVGFAAGREMVLFSAPDHSVYWAETFGTAGETIEFGQVSLGGRQDLSVQLVSGSDVDFTRFRISTKGAEPLPERTFDNAGRVVFENISAGGYLLFINSDENLQFLRSASLVPGEDWQYTIPVGGGYRVRVSVDAEAELPDDAHFSLTLPTTGIPIRVTAPVPAERVLEVSSLYPGEVSAELLSPSSAEWPAAKGTILESTGVLELEIDLQTAGQRFHIVDSQGRSVPHAVVRLYPWDGKPPGWDAIADGRGECVMRPFKAGHYRAYLEHPELGYHYGLSVEVPSVSDESIEILFAPERAIELRLMDGAEPLSGVSCLPVEEQGYARLPLASTDSQGLVAWTAVGAGRFKVQVRQPGLWPTDAEVEALPPGQPIEVQARRLGDLDVSVTRTGGTSANSMIQLESLEFTVSVASWLADGRATSSTGSLAVDGQGRVSLTGLPHGTYAWSVDGASGLVEVRPGKREELEVLLP